MDGTRGPDLARGLDFADPCIRWIFTHPSQWCLMVQRWCGCTSYSVLVHNRMHWHCRWLVVVIMYLQMEYNLITSPRSYCDPSCLLVDVFVCSLVCLLTLSCGENGLDMETWFHWTTIRKWRTASQMVTWRMMSCVLERPKSWPEYVGAQYLENGYRVETWLQWRTWGIKWSHVQWHHVSYCLHRVRQ